MTGRDDGVDGRGVMVREKVGLWAEAWVRVAGVGGGDVVMACGEGCCAESVAVLVVRVAVPRVMVLRAVAWRVMVSRKVMVPVAGGAGGEDGGELCRCRR